MIILTEIKITNGNNYPPLFHKKLFRRFTSMRRINAYRKQLKKLAMRKYSKTTDDIHIDLRFVEV
jgi:hypothetical protein